MTIATQAAWRDVLYDEQFILAASTLIAGLVTYFGYVIKSAIARLQVKADATHEQVANTHTVNLRDDIDEKFRQVEAKSDEQHAQVMEEMLKLTQVVSQVCVESGKQHAAMWEAIQAKTDPQAKRIRKRK